MAFLSFLRRGKKKEEEDGTLNYGSTLQADNSKTNLMRRFDEAKMGSVCNREGGPCDKKAFDECMKCEDLDQVVEMLKNSLIVSQAHGEMGERYPVTPTNHDAWRELYLTYLSAKKRLPPDHAWVLSLARDLKMVDASFSFRSIRREHTRVDVAGPEQLYKFFQLFMQQSGRGKQITFTDS